MIALIITVIFLMIYNALQGKQIRRLQKELNELRKGSEADAVKSTIIDFSDH